MGENGGKESIKAIIPSNYLGLLDTKDQHRMGGGVETILGNSCKISEHQD